MVEFDAQTEYEEHAKLVAKDGIKLPAWDDLKDYEKALWEDWATAREKEQA